MKSHIVCPVACVLLIPMLLHAQRLEPVPVSFRASQALRVPSNAPELVQRGNHGAEGALIGGVALGIFGYWVASKGCQASSVPVAPGSSYVSCTTGTKLAFGGATGLLGAGLGYLIGTGYPKYVEQ